MEINSKINIKNNNYLKMPSSKSSSSPSSRRSSSSLNEWSENLFRLAICTLSMATFTLIGATCGYLFSDFNERRRFCIIGLIGGLFAGMIIGCCVVPLLPSERVDVWITSKMLRRIITRSETRSSTRSTSPTFSNYSLFSPNDNNSIIHI